MKLKLEPNVLATQYSKKGVFTEIIAQAKVKISQSLLTPHLKLNRSAQVPKEQSMNSKGFFNTNQSKVFISNSPYLTEKNLNLLGKKKASLIHAYSLFSQESFFIFFAFPHSVYQGSSLSSSILINTN